MSVMGGMPTFAAVSTNGSSADLAAVRYKCSVSSATPPAIVRKGGRVSFATIGAEVGMAVSGSR